MLPESAEWLHEQSTVLNVKYEDERQPWTPGCTKEMNIHHTD